MKSFTISRGGYHFPIKSGYFSLTFINKIRTRNLGSTNINLYICIVDKIYVKLLIGVQCGGFRTQHFDCWRIGSSPITPTI